MGIQVSETDCLTEAKEFVLDEAIFDGVEFVDIVYHLSASIAHGILNEC
jgi:hypothetical protein